MLSTGKNEQFSLQALQIIDGLIVWGAFTIASVVRWKLMATGVEGIGLGPIIWMLYIAVPFTPLLLEFFGFYKDILRKKNWTAVVQILRAGLLLAAMLAGVVIFFQVEPSSRFVLIIGAGLTCAMLYFRFAWLRNFMRRRIAKGAAREKVILAGTPADIEEFIGEMTDSVTDYWEVCEHFDLSTRDPFELRALIKQHSVERVIISPRSMPFERVSLAVEVCETQGLEVWVAANFIRSQVSRPAFDTLGGRPMLVMKSTPELSWSLMVKSVFDRTVALVMLIMTSPLWLFAAVGIKLTSPGPIFFRQDRAGKYGKRFRMWKFRTMMVDAEKRLEEVKQQVGNQMEGPVFKLDNDPRVFPFARLLRKLSIDELPQLLNVLAGEMSLVGPRPLPVYEVEKFEKSAYRRRLSVLPGITCTWQAGGRNTITSFEEWVEMDLQYIDNWSIWLDFKILLQTIPAVLFAKGAK